jgi:HlyD family secretion protein
MAKSRKRRRIIVFSVIIIALVALTLAVVLKKREPIITVQTEKVARRDLVERVTASGKVQPVVSVTISPEVSGEITALPNKEGQFVKKGDLLVKIKPDFYVASFNQAKATYESAVAGRATAQANLNKADADYVRNKELFAQHLVSESDYIGFKAAQEVAKAQLDSAIDQVDVAQAGVASAQDSLDKTTIVAPLTGTITRLNSQVGERVLGTVQNVGTEIMTISDLNEMEALVDIGETDVVLIKPGQIARLDVDAFKDRKFTGTVTDVANSATGTGSSTQAASTSSSTGQEATKFQVHIRIKDKEGFRPGMSVTADIETRYRTNVLTVPIASVTTRLPRMDTNGIAGSGGKTNLAAIADPPSGGTNGAGHDHKLGEAFKPIPVVFMVENDRARMVPVKIGIGDDAYWEITDGLKEGGEVVSGGFRAIEKDLDDGKKISRGPAGGEMEKKPS